ncbi:MAG: alpha/beta hydrolase [Myxococcota bacterium]
MTILSVLLLGLAIPAETFSILSLDGLEISVEFYRGGTDSAPVIVLLHQAGWSRGEYREIAPKLTERGFNCFAVDLRSGDKVNGVPNDTAKHAKSREMPTGFVDARQDIVAALKYARKKLTRGGPVIAWGSSYSAALVLHIAGSEDGLADGVLSFSPGEYFKREGKGTFYITGAARNVRVPTYITSSKSEAKQVKRIFDAIPGDRRTHYVPESAGKHGSRALWTASAGHEGYWKSVNVFLDTHFPREKTATNDR